MVAILPLLNRDPGHQLRYALRSLAKHGVTRCILVGGKPKWYKGEHLPFKDYGPDRKEENIRDKVHAACKAFHVEEFIFANDDHILLQPLTQIHNKGTLSTTLQGRIGNGSYTRCLRNTFNHYGDVPNVDTHAPMLMTTAGVERTMFEWPAWGIGFKTCYAQENGITSVYYPDMKIDKPSDITGREYFSLTDAFRDYKWLEEMFGEPSLFEK